jgi:cytochrome c biogenesis protein
MSRLGPAGWARWVWRQLTSMRTTLYLLLLLAIASVPDSVVPQRTADPNEVVQYFRANPTLAPVLDSLQVFDSYSSVWFSSIYILLFISLIGCVIPRTIHHFRVLRAEPPATPSRLARLSGFTTLSVRAGTTYPTGEPITAASAVDAARTLLRRGGYRVATFQGHPRRDASEMSVSAERGYLREAGNLLFHTALLGILFAVGIGGGFGFTAQRVVVQGQSMINTLSAYDSLNPVLRLNVFSGDLGLDQGIPKSAYALDTPGPTQLTSGKAGSGSIELALDQTQQLPDSLGSGL